MQGYQRIAVADLVGISIDTASPWHEDLGKAFGDACSLGSSPMHDATGSSALASSLRVDYAPTLSTDGLRRLQSDLYVGEGVLVDRRYGVQLLGSRGRELRLCSDTACLEWLSWALQLALLKARATFVHGAGLERDGSALLLPSWGGVGKTAIAKHFVADLGWRLLGDDLVILTEQEECLAFPKRMVLYPYHRAVFPEVFASGQGPVAPQSANKLLSRLAIALKPWLRLSPSLLQWARKHNPQSVRVNPSAVFGTEGLARRAQLCAVVWLDRMPGLDTPVLREASADDLVSRMFGSTLREQDPWCINATLVACGLGMMDAREIFAEWIDVLGAATASASHWLLLIPEATPIDDVAEAVENALRSALPELLS